MHEATVIPPGGGEIIGDTADRRVEILCDDDALHVTWSRFGPGRDGADLHIHHEHTDLFYVLEGTFTLRLGVEGEEVALPAGTIARVPPLVVHGFRNGSADAEVRYLNFHAPGAGFAAYMRGLRDGQPVDFDQADPPADGGRPTSEAVVGGPVEIDAITVTEASGAAPAHADPGHIHALYVLEGELTLTLGDEDRQAPAGTWIQIPAGMPHSVSDGARYLAVRAPAAQG